MAGSASDATATFALDLESNAADVAPNAAAALEQLRNEIRGGIDELRGMQGALRMMKGAAGVAGETITQLKDKITAQKAVVAQQQASYVRLGGSFRSIRSDAKHSASGLRELLEAVRGAPGPLGALSARLGGIGAALGGGAIVGGIVGIAGAMLALAGAAVTAAGALARYALTQADARRSELLRLEGLSKHRNYWMAAAGFALVADRAEFLQGTIDQVADSVAIGRDKIVDYASSLYKAGLRGGNLQAALEGISTVAAVQGDSAAEAWKGWATGAALTGQSVRALANDVKARLGGIAARQLLSLDVQSRKLKENFARIFSGVRVERMLDGVSKVTELFSQTTASGRALKTIAETLLNPIGEAIGFVGPLVKDFFRGMIIATQFLIIQILSVRLWFKKTFGDHEILKGINMTAAAMSLGLLAVTMLGGALTALALPMVATVAAFAALKASFDYAVIGVKAAWAALQAIDWAVVGRNVIDGIVNGIKAGIQKVKDVIKSVGDVIQGAFANRMQIRSPSKVMFKMGKHVDEGIRGGIEAGRPQVERATQSLAATVRDEFKPQQRPTSMRSELKRPEAALPQTAASARAEAAPQLAQVIQLFGGRGDHSAPATLPSRDSRRSGAAPMLAAPEIRLQAPEAPEAAAP